MSASPTYGIEGRCTAQNRGVLARRDVSQHIARLLAIVGWRDVRSDLPGGSGIKCLSYGTLTESGVDVVELIVLDAGGGRQAHAVVEGGIDIDGGEHALIVSFYGIPIYRSDKIGVTDDPITTA